MKTEFQNNMYKIDKDLIFNDFYQVVNYNNKEYPYRIIKFEGYNVIVSTIALQCNLLTEEYDYVDLLAEYIDECIFFYLNSNEIYKDDEYIVHILSQSVS